MNTTATSFADYHAHGSQMTVPNGTCIFRPGDDTSAFLLVTSGTVRVEQANSTGVAIPAERFRTLLTTDARFQELVFRGFAARVGELTDVIDDLLEHRTDLRLARWLSVRGSTEIHMTQQEVAQELGTAREVVSRTLKSFETQGWIKLGRRSLTVTDAQALAQHGQAHEL